MISVIIPVYNEISTIDALIGQLEAICEPWEVIFADGGSTDGTEDRIPEKYSLIHCDKGRANQMNAGAEASRGEILFFLHCDSIIPKDAAFQIERIMKKYRAGCFGIKFTSSSFLMKCCQFLSNFRVRFYNVAFGDQGIFIERELFFKLGGFPLIPIMEDYQLSLTLRKNRIRIGMTDERIITSDRRYREGGKIKTMWKMYKLRRYYRKGTDIEVIAEMYKDIR